MRRVLGARIGAGVARVCLPLALLCTGGCSCSPESADSRSPSRSVAVSLAVHVFADTGRGGHLEVRPPEARVWLASVTPARQPVPAPALPEMLPDSLPPLDEAPPGLEVDPGLKPPILRAPGTLALPPGWRGPRASVDLDVRVDESGRVSDALPVREGRDPAVGDAGLVEAARRCALGMRFYPALQGGRAVSVWCRQRFDFGEARR
jgi:hypothetical protein